MGVVVVGVVTDATREIRDVETGDVGVEGETGDAETINAYASPIVVILLLVLVG